MPRPSFPKSIFEFQQWFPDEEACLKFLIESRWPDGFICPRCGFNEYYWKKARQLLECKRCGYQASVTAGTVMHRSKMPLKVWFHAAYLVTTHTPGMSALQFQRQMGLSSYQTAFTMLHKLRSAMVRSGRDRLNGIVEVDETYVGGERPGRVGRGALGKVIVAGAVDLRGKYVSVWAGTYEEHVSIAGDETKRYSYVRVESDVSFDTEKNSLDPTTRGAIRYESQIPWTEQNEAFFVWIKKNLELLIERLWDMEQPQTLIEAINAGRLLPLGQLEQ